MAQLWRRTWRLEKCFSTKVQSVCMVAQKYFMGNITLRYLFIMCQSIGLFATRMRSTWYPHIGWTASTGRCIGGETHIARVRFYQYIQVICIAYFLSCLNFRAWSTWRRATGSGNSWYWLHRTNLCGRMVSSRKRARNKLYFGSPQQF